LFKSSSGKLGSDQLATLKTAIASLNPGELQGEGGCSTEGGHDQLTIIRGNERFLLDECDLFNEKALNVNGQFSLRTRSSELHEIKQIVYSLYTY